MVLEMIDLLCDGDTHLFVDPAFGDHGRLYSLLDSGLPAQMRRLCARARTITPNLTEAGLSAGRALPRRYAGGSGGGAAVPGPAGPRPGERGGHGRGGKAGPDGRGGLGARHGRAALLYRERYEGLFHGTGDVLASLLLGALMRGKSLPDAATLALDLTHQALRLTLAGGEPLR